MSLQRPTLPKGTRDFGPEQMARRNFILSTIRDIFELYGYQPLETPSMENLSVLMGKYGEEGDQLLFKILNSGDFLKNVNKDDLKLGSKKTLSKVSEKGLRYDLTVPFARYVAMHQHEMELPFKRYQMQPVWRADRPQKGRYREFLQCDADVVGSDAPLNDAEIIAMLCEIFHRLGIGDISIKLNHRNILTSLAAITGNPELESAFCIALDKKDKIGKEKVKEELLQAGFESSGIQTVFPILEITGENDDRLKKLKSHFSNHNLDDSGIQNIESILSIVEKIGDLSIVDVDFSLARGLSYYTGAIFEVTLNDRSIGSLSGGGRYDNLTGVFGVSDVPGVGISLGVDRIYDVMINRDLFDQVTLEVTKVLVVTFDSQSFHHAFPLLGTFRKNGIACELYPEPTKLKKQLNYANKKNIPYVVLIGSEEMTSGNLTLKSMASGEQQQLSIEKIIELLRKK